MIGARRIHHAAWLSSFGLACGLALAAACGTAAGDTSDESTGPLSCEHGMYSECACPDGSMGTQLCAHDTSGFEPCMCGGDEAGPTTAEGSDGPATTVGTTASSDDGVATTGDDAATSDPSGPTSDSGDATSGVGADTTGAVGEPPVAMISHPGPEERQAGVPIPFIGAAMDPEDGALAGMSLQWTDDLEGPIGEGTEFDAALDIIGEHTVTLVAQDADGNIGEASITFDIVP